MWTTLVDKYMRIPHLNNIVAVVCSTSEKIKEVNLTDVVGGLLYCIILLPADLSVSDIL